MCCWRARWGIHYVSVTTAPFVGNVMEEANTRLLANGSQHPFEFVTYDCKGSIAHGANPANTTAPMLI